MEYVTVIIPLYNKERHIERAINSVLNQSYKQFELIIVDDGSTDSSSEIVEKIKDKRLRLIRQQNGGVSSARNRGIKESKYNLIAFLDADDEWQNGFLETILRLRINFPNAGIYSTDFSIVQEDGSSRKVKQIDIPIDQLWEGEINYFNSVMLGGRPVCSSTAVIPKEIFSQVGCFELGVSHGEDTDMWGRIAIKYPIVFSSHIQVTYYKNAENRAVESFKNEKEWIFEKRIKKLEEKGEISELVLKDIKEYIANKKIQLAKLYIFNGMGTEGRRILKECLTKRFIYKKFYWILWSLVPYNFVLFSLNIKKRLRKRLRRIKH